MEAGRSASSGQSSSVGIQRWYTPSSRSGSGLSALPPAGSSAGVGELPAAVASFARRAAFSSFLDRVLKPRCPPGVQPASPAIPEPRGLVCYRQRAIGSALLAACATRHKTRTALLVSALPVLVDLRLERFLRRLPEKDHQPVTVVVRATNPEPRLAQRCDDGSGLTGSLTFARESAAGWLRGELRHPDRGAHLLLKNQTSFSPSATGINPATSAPPRLAAVHPSSRLLLAATNSARLQ